MQIEILFCGAAAVQTGSAFAGGSGSQCSALLARGDLKFTMAPTGAEKRSFLLRDTRKTECGANQFPIRSAVRAAPFALLRDTRKTERGARLFPIRSAVRAAPFALLRDTRKTERGASLFPIRSAVRAAAFAVLRNTRKTERGARLFPIRSAVRAAPFALVRVNCTFVDLKAGATTCQR